MPERNSKNKADGDVKTGRGSRQMDGHWRQVRSDLGLPDAVSVDLLAQAFCHASYAREAGLGANASNQRLEFLGDAVLDLILVEHLYGRHQGVPEGTLTKMKAAAARSQTLARVARQRSLGDYLCLGHGEEETGGRKKPSLLADCLEALVGAVYLSTDLGVTRAFVLGWFAEALSPIEAQDAVYDFKTALQELVQRETKRTPVYVTAETLGPPHARTFVVEVHFDGWTIGTGQGSSKQTAQQSAAHNALEHRAEWLEKLRLSGERK